MSKFDPFDVTVPHVAYAALGGFVVLFGMFSLLLREKLYIGEACWAFLFGVVVGPYGANIFNPRGWADDNGEAVNTITLELTRVVLAIGVFAIGVELPKAYMRRHWRSLFFLLGPVMIWKDEGAGELTSARCRRGGFLESHHAYCLRRGIVGAPRVHLLHAEACPPLELLLSTRVLTTFTHRAGLDFLSSLAVAACLTPTDPILAAAVVGGKYADKHVPAHIRHLLAAESGCNDGAAFPFLYIALYLVLDSTTKDAISDWFLKLWLYQVILGVVIGSLIGISFRHLMKFSERHSLIDRHSYVAQYVSLALLTIGLTTLLGSDDLLSAFACGAAFAWDGFFNRQTEESVFSSVIDLLFNVAAFVYVGAWMPFASFEDPEGTTLQVWRLVVLAICVLLLRRLPVMVALYRWIPDIKTLREAVFSGHFGPIGVGAVFISTLATQVLQESPLAVAGAGGNPQVVLLAKTIQPICAFMVLCSVAIHGLSIPSFSLGRRVHSVSRTWSRHTTATATAVTRPDWMDHVRHAGGGVVVNRDRDEEEEEEEEGGVAGAGDLEMGLGGQEKEREVVDGRPLEEIDVRTGQSESPTAVGSVPGSRDSEKKEDAEKEGQRQADIEAGLRPEGDIPPDGEELISEWQEGSHRIIERRAGPGEEVEVEVIRNVDGEHVSSAYRGPEAVVRGLVERLRGAPHAVEMDIEALGRGIEERLAHSPIFGHGHHHHQHHAAGDDANEDEDEGWASDHSEGAGAGSSSSPSPDRGDRRKRSNSPKAKAASSSSSRRRGSVSRKGKGLLGHAQQFMRNHRPRGAASPPPSSPSPSAAALRPLPAAALSSSASSFESPTPPEESQGPGQAQPSGRATDFAYTHGRPSVSRAASSRGELGGASGTTTPRQGRRSRVDSLRLQHSARASREASPARSVRFAEGPGSGASTPLVSVFGEEVRVAPGPVGTGTGILEDGADNGDGDGDGGGGGGGERGKGVTFELPETGGSAGKG
ncbi:Sodium/hydrogen exchanger family-domain-containing protein [Mycena galericulata]|nr:Sodium/hydrogen exchanger family-domain-containing protein [Mycena galericulata]